MKYCKLENCDNYISAKDLCNKHYLRQMRTGSTEGGVRWYLNNGQKSKYKENRPEYTSWSGMKSRTTNPNMPRYDRYGGRGIEVCDRWLYSFNTFLEDMGKKPTPQHSLDRIDNDGDYTPENCRWATHIEQQNNRSNNRRN